MLMLILTYRPNSVSPVEMISLPTRMLPRRLRASHQICRYEQGIIIRVLIPVFTIKHQFRVPSFHNNVRLRQAQGRGSEG